MLIKSLRTWYADNVLDFFQQFPELFKQVYNKDIKKVADLDALWDITGGDSYFDLIANALEIANGEYTLDYDDERELFTIKMLRE